MTEEIEYFKNLCSQIGLQGEVRESDGHAFIYCGGPLMREWDSVEEAAGDLAYENADISSFA